MVCVGYLSFVKKIRPRSAKHHAPLAASALPFEHFFDTRFNFPSQSNSPDNCEHACLYVDWDCRADVVQSPKWFAAYANLHELKTSGRDWGAKQIQKPNVELIALVFPFFREALCAPDAHAVLNSIRRTAFSALLTATSAALCMSPKERLKISSHIVFVGPLGFSVLMRQIR